MYTKKILFIFVLLFLTFVHVSCAPALPFSLLSNFGGYNILVKTGGSSSESQIPIIHSEEAILVSPESLVVNMSETISYVLDSTIDALLAIDLATGNRTIVSSSSMGSGVNLSSPQSVVLSSSETTAYVVDSTLGSLFSVDIASGNRTIISK